MVQGGAVAGRALGGVAVGAFDGEAVRRGVPPLRTRPCLAGRGHVGEAGDFPRGVVAVAVHVLCSGEQKIHFP